MKTTAEIIEILRDYKARSAEKYGIDTLMDIKDDLEQVFRQKVDLITLHKTMRALFRRKIEQDAIYL